MRKTRNRLIAWLLSAVMVLSLLLNVSYNAEAEENVVTLPGTTVKVYTYVNGVQSDITADTVLKNGDQVKLVLGWQVNNTEGNSITAETDLQYDLAYSGLVLSNSSGSVLQNGIAVGTYNIDGDGVLHMNITDSTLLSQSDISGGLEIDATINTAGLVEDENGQSQAVIAGQTIKVQVTDPNTLPSVSKSRSGDVYIGADNNSYQNFTVTLTDNSNSDSITFTDTFGGYLSYVSGTMQMDGNAVSPTDNGDGTLSYTIANPVKGQQYTITYTALVSPDAFKNDYWYSSNDRAYYNTATVTNSNGSTATSETFALGYKSWISKWGSYDANTDTIFWCVTVNGGDKFNFLNSQLKDTVPAGMEIVGNVIVKNSSGGQVAAVDQDGKTSFTQNFSEYVIGADPTGTYTIEYRTKATSANAGLANKEYTNTATITNSTINLEKTATATVSVKEDWLTKKYISADATPVGEADGTITWESVITIPESQSDSVRLNFADTFGPGLDYVDGSFSATYNGADITASSSFNKSADGFTAIFNGLSYTAGQKVVITYQTTYTVDDGATQQDFVNTATITDPNGNTESDSASYRYTESNTNIVPYKWHTGTTGTASTWGIQVNGANKYYDDVAAGKRIYIYDTPTLTSTDGTAIDAGYTVVPGSIKVGSNATDLITASYAADGKTIIFDITEYIKNNQYNCYYFELYYTIALDDETVRYMLEHDINQANMTNQVDAYLYSSDGSTEEDTLGSTVGNGTGTPSIGTMLTKSYTYDATTAPYANYKIDINPQALDLIDGNGTLSLKDVMGKDLQVDISTIKLLDAAGKTIVGTTTAFDSSTNTLVINNIPDSTHCILTYTVRVNVNYTAEKPTFESLGNSIDVGNDCYLYANNETYSSSETRITGTIQKSSAWADSDYGSIIISKHSGLTVLGGAEFTVTAYKIDDDGNLVVNSNYATEYANKGVTIGSFVTDSNGKKTVNLLFDILYVVTESQAPAGYAKLNEPIYIIIPGQDYDTPQGASNVSIASAVAALEGQGITVNKLTSGATQYVENEPLSQYSAQIVKSDQYGDYVAGATFELLMDDGNGNYVPATDSNGTAITGTTDSYGRITFNNLEAGSYKINETVVPEGYVKTDTSEQMFVLSESSPTATMYVKNTKLFGSITITKKEFGSNTVLQGVTFGLYEGGNLIATATTDGNGQVVFDELKLNVEYTVKEESTIDGYILGTDEIKFTPSGTTSATLDYVGTVNNFKQSGNIRITKTEEGSDPVVPVQGAVYTLYDSEQNIVYDENGVPVTATTDASGEAIFTGLKFGKYYVRETMAPELYELDTALYDVPLVDSNNGYSEKALTNKKKVIKSPYMSFKFKKNGYDETGTSQGGLAGAEFELRQDGIVVDRAISDADGYVYFLNVTTYDENDGDRAYQYNISETTAPYGYIRDTQGISFTADNLEPTQDTYHHSVLKTVADKASINELPSSMLAGDYSFDNYKAVGKVVLKKIDSDYQNPLAGARYAAYKDGSDTPSAVATSDDDGLLTFTGLQYGSTYVFKEIQAPEGYIVSDDTITVTIGVGQTSIEPYNGSVTIDNVYVYENIVSAPNDYTVTDDAIALNISKQSITGSSEVHGAKLKLTDARGNVIDSWTSTNSPHKIDSEKLKVNTVYTLTETAAPDGYGYSEEISFKIAENGDIVILSGSDENATANNDTHTVVMKDKAIGFNLAKVDKITGKRLTGATMQLLKSDGTTVLAEWTSSNSGDYTIDSALAENIGLKVPAAKGEYTEYIFRETKAPSGYLKAEDIHFYIDYSGDVYLKNSAGAYASVEDNRIIMQDLAFTDDVVISKVGITGAAELPGASLTIIDKTNNNTVVDAWTSTDTARTIDISKFVNGHTYELIETGAPQGYAYAESIEFTINDDGKVEIGGTVQDGNLVTMTDDAISVDVYKKDEAGTVLEGAELTLYSQLDGEIATFTSGDTAENIGQHLKAGTVDANGDDVLSQYKLVETKVPFGYKRADDMYFAINSKGELYISTDLGANYSKAASNVLTMTDEDETVHISKYDITNSKEIDGAQLKIVKASDGSMVTNWESDKAAGPKELNVAEFFEADTVYKLVETTAPYGYEIAEEIEFKFDENSVLYVKYSGAADFTSVDNDTITMYDEISNIKISKVDATNGNELPGAHLVITDINGVVIDEWDSTVDKHEIPVIGNFVANLEYTLTETIAPYGYDIAETITFKLTNDGTVQVKIGDTWTALTDDTVVMKDNVKSAYFSKVDATNSKEISGAQLKVTKAEDGSLVDSWESGAVKHNIPISEFEVDEVYVLTETTAPFGYEVAESICFKIDAEGKVLVANAAGAYVEVNKNTVVMKDEAKYMSISKVDATNKEELPGASLTITNKDTGNVIDSWISSTVVHKIKMADLTPGVEYVLTEKTAPQGYEKAENIVFKLDEAGKVYVLNNSSWVAVTDGIVVMEDEETTTATTTETTVTTTEATTEETTVTTTEATTEETTVTTTEATTEETTATTTEATTEETTATTTETTTTTEGSSSGDLDDPSGGYGTPGTPDTPTTATDTPTDDSTSTSTDSHIKTGDDAPISMVFMLMILSAFGIFIIGRSKQRQ